MDVVSLLAAACTVIRNVEPASLARLAGSTLRMTACTLVTIITLVGVVWAVVRERHMVDMHNEQTFAISDIDRTINDGSESIRAGFNAIARQIERAMKSPSRDDAKSSNRSMTPRIGAWIRCAIR